MASYTAALATDEDPPVLVSKGLETKIQFKLSEHMNHVKITISNIAVVRLNHEHEAFMAGDLEEVDTKNFTELSGIEITDGGSSSGYKLRCQYKRKHINAENIFAKDFGNGLDLLKSLFVKPEGCFIVFIYGRTKHSFEELQAAFARDNKQSDFPKWIEAGLSELVPRQGQFPEKKARPSEWLEPKNSFFNWPEYCIVLSIGALQNDECIRGGIESYEKGTHSAYFAKFPGGNNRRCFVFLPYPEKGETRIEKGMLLRVETDPISASFSSLWNAVVCANFPGQPANTFCAHMTRRKSGEEKDTDEKSDDDILTEAIEWKPSDSKVEFQKKLANASTREVEVKIDTSDGPFNRGLQALAKINSNLSMNRKDPNNKVIEQILLSNNFLNLPKNDVYASVRDEIPHPEENMVLNEDQREVVTNLASNAPGKITVVQGPPGTGKTHLIGEMIKPFVCSKGKKVLLTSAGNVGADHLALKANKLVTDAESTNLEGRFVVRLHSLSTENDVVLADARKKRADVPKSNSKGAAKLVEERLDQLEITNPLRQHYDDETHKRFPGINDKRLTNLDTALGTRMLQMAGLRSGGPKSLEQFARFRQLYNKYADNEQWEDETKEEFQKELSWLMEDTLEKASIVCCTVFGLSEPHLIKSYADAKIVVIDEAARVTDFEMAPIWANYYPNIDGLILVGDPFQLPPVVESTQERDSKIINCFGEQLAISFQTRLQNGNFDHRMLKIQYRMVPQIGEIVSKYHYNNLLEHAESTLVSNRQIAQELCEFNREEFHHSNSIVWIDILHAVTETPDYSKSRCNVMFVKYTINLLVKVFNRFPTATIAILTFYREQKRLFLAAQHELRKTDARYANVVIDTVDGQQGNEYDIVFLNFLLRNGNAGFQDKSYRWNVGISRARNGLYLLAPKWEWVKVDGNFGNLMGAFNDYRFVEHDENITCRYVKSA